MCLHEMFRQNNALESVNTDHAAVSPPLTIADPYAPIMTAADDSLEYFIIVFQRKLDLIYHVNPLLKDSHEISSLIFFQR